MKLSKIADFTGGHLYGHDCEVAHFFIDSRFPVQAGAAFFAIHGKRHNGHRFIKELYERGIRIFVVSERMEFDAFPAASFVLVTDTLRALQQTAAYHRSQFTCPVVGITGSNGKTIVKEWIWQLLQGTLNVVRSPKSYNSQVGVPLSVLLLDENTSLGVFEAGISETDEMRYLEPIIQPTIGILTNIGEAHQENFNDLQQKLEEKLQLFTHAETLIYSCDNDFIHQYISTAPQPYRTFTWGHAATATVRVGALQTLQAATVVELYYQANQFSLHIPFTDTASVEDVLHCVALLLKMGYPPRFIVEGVEKLSPIAMRLELKAGINNCTLINDSYNSDFNSLTIALDFLSGMTQHPQKTLILSDIFQSNKNEEELYREVARLLPLKGVTRFIGIGPALCRQAGLFDPQGEFFLTTDDFLKQYNKTHFNKEAILLKGSRFFRFETISQLLEFKLHQTVLEVNLNALVHNLNYCRTTLQSGVKLMAMVKAFSYGAGSYEIAGLLQFHRVDYLAVAYADEGIVLRNSGITMPIVVLNPEPDSFDTMISYRLEPEIYNFYSLRAFLHSALQMGVEHYPIHLKIDTGMHRLGFIAADVEELCVQLNKQSQARVSSIFSHLAASDEGMHDGFTRQQITEFSRHSDTIIERIGYKPLRHILNSSGIERFPDAQFDMVRLGLGLYGIGATATAQANLQHVGTLSSAIVQIKEIEAGDTVGYGRHGKVSKKKRIATVPIGYADGLNRRLSRGVGYFMLRDQPVPIIGNICMDTCMVDVTGTDAKEGDRLVVFGEKPSVSEIAEKIGTIPYEVLTGISERVKRVYYSE